MTKTISKALAALAVTASVFGLSASAQAGDAASCQTVRMSDVGWTDVTAVTALTGAMLDAALGVWLNAPGIRWPQGLVPSIDAGAPRATREKLE